MRTLKNIVVRLSGREDWFLLICLVIVFLANSFIIKQYGVSYDEPWYYEYADINAQIYSKMAHGEPYEQLFQFYNLEYYGTAYLVLANPVAHLVTDVFPNLDIYNSWHIVNFLVFLLGDWVLYKLSAKFVSRRAALVAALLFLTQPLLWGHGIMNPKDSIFMVFFVMAVYFGIEMIDRFATGYRFGLSKIVSTLSGFFKTVEEKVAIGWKVGLGVLFLIIVGDRVFANALTAPLVKLTLNMALNVPSGSFLQTTFDRLANHAGQISFGSYANKVLNHVDLIEFYLIALVVLLAVLYFLLKTEGKYWPAFVAGAFLGIATSIRVAGPAAAGLVLAYAIIRRPQKPWKMLGIYVVTGLLTSYIFWPYLWSAPISRFIISARVMANFPWTGRVLFDGQDLAPSQLPWFYLPKLIGIQFTIPLLLLSFAGLVFVIIKRQKSLQERLIYLIPFLWFFVPLLGVIILRPPLYDNFRQFLFIIPPLFLFAAVGLEQLYVLLQSNVTRSIISLIILIPGIVAMIWLHPYEYVYYNGFVGWTGNVGRQYENDYWATSYCAAGEYLTEHAAPNARIAVANSIYSSLISECAPDDHTQVVPITEYSQPGIAYTIVSSRYDDDLYKFKDMQTVDVIGKGNTVFTTVKAQKQSVQVKR